MEVSDGEMTKWLLTPTNNHSTEDNVRAGQEDFTSTEWLTKHHSQAKPGKKFQSKPTTHHTHASDYIAYVSVIVAIDS